MSTFQPGNLTVWGSEGVKWSFKVEAERRNDRRGEHTVCRRVCKWAHFSARKFDSLGQWMVIQSRCGTTKWHQLSVSALQTEGQTDQVQTDQVAWGVYRGKCEGRQTQSISMPFSLGLTELLSRTTTTTTTKVKEQTEQTVRAVLASSKIFALQNSFKSSRWHR